MYFIIEYGFLLITVAITLGAQFYVNSTYKKMEKVQNKKGRTGRDVARLILDNNDLKSNTINETAGVLSDHYDPRSKSVNLSPEIYSGASIASISVASHECGHAIQDKNGYFFLRLRSAIIPLVNFASTAGYIAIMIGIFAQALNIIWIGIILEVVILLFQLITLPVEFNASRRALEKLQEYNIVDEEELKSCKKMLRAAALTYVAAAATAFLEIVKLVLLFARNDRD